MEADWDLQAVVRACISSSSVTPSSNIFADCSINSSSSSSCLSFNGEQASHLFPPGDPSDPKITDNIGDLHELFKPLFEKTQPFNFQPLPHIIAKEQTQFKQPNKQFLGGVSSNSHLPRSKRRKNQMKKVCHVPVEALAADVWAWRKYGQKPIKGSPYPRGYYRCSSSKGCLARKQVERNRSDPKMFIITYTAEHNHPAPTHRNSLAGSTRQKTLTPQGVDSDKEPPKPSCFSPVSSQDDDPQPSNNTGSPEKKEEDQAEEEENFLALSDDAVSDDFFAGLEEFTSSSPADDVVDSLELPWFSNSKSTATGGGSLLTICYQ